MKVKLPTPCNQNFNGMPLVSNGRKCAMCNKVVIDFTKMSIEEIKSYFLDDKNREICGIFKPEHVEKKISFFQKVNLALNWTLKSLQPLSTYIVFSLIFSQCKSTKIVKQGIEVRDYDSDGLVGKEDECEHSAGTKELFGCPDSDKDGIGDSRDRELQSPEGYPVDIHGVALIPKPYDINEKISPERILGGIPPMRESTDEHYYTFIYEKGESSTKSSTIKTYLETILRDYKTTSYFEVNIVVNNVLDLKRNFKLKERVQLMKSYLFKGGVSKSDIKVSENNSIEKNDISIITRGR